MDSIDYGVLFMDDQLRARIVNQAFRTIWEIPADFVTGHPTMRELMAFNHYSNIYPVSAHDNFEEYMDKREADVRRGAIAPTSFERRDGMILQYQCVVLPNGWRMLTYFDITELKTPRISLPGLRKWKQSA